MNKLYVILLFLYCHIEAKTLTIVNNTGDQISILFNGEYISIENDQTYVFDRFMKFVPIRYYKGTQRKGHLLMTYAQYRPWQQCEDLQLEVMIGDIELSCLSTPPPPRPTLSTSHIGSKGSAWDLFSGTGSLGRNPTWYEVIGVQKDAPINQIYKEIQQLDNYLKGEHEDIDPNVISDAVVILRKATRDAENYLAIKYPFSFVPYRKSRFRD